MRLTRLFVILILISDVAHSATSEWLSIEASEVGKSLTLLSPPKNWTFKNGRFIEKDSSTFEIDCLGFLEEVKKVSSETSSGEINKTAGKFIKKVQTEKAEVSLLDFLALRTGVISDIVGACFNPTSTILKYNLRSKSNDRYVYESKDSTRRLIFFRNPVSGFRPVHLTDSRPFLSGSLRNFSAVFNMFGISYDNSLVISFRSGIRRLVFDRSFPQHYIQETLNALKKWNTALGVPAFPSHYSVSDVDPIECFSTQTLCFQWKGSPVLAWAGLGGYADASFDPTSGETIGGIISISNEVPGPLEKTPEDIRQKFLNDNLELKDMAELYLDRKKMLGFEHPLPTAVIGSFMIHELGHFVGLVHNFAGSNSWTPKGSAKTAMDYLPFPAINSHAAEVQKWDYWAIQSRKNNHPMPKDYSFCSDSEGDQVTLSLANQFENPNCKKDDLGTPINWALLLAEKSPEGLSGVDETLQFFGKSFPILRHLGIFFFDKKSERPGYHEALNYVCKNRSLSIEESFLAIFKKPLECSK